MAEEKKIPEAEDIADTADIQVEEPVQEPENESAETAPAADAEAEESGKISFREKKKLKAELQKLQTQVDEALKNAEELRDRYTRMCAEFENYKRRTDRELVARYEDAKGDVWKSILPIMDNFERALSQSESGVEDGYRQGVEMIYRQLVETAKAAGVTEIEALRTEFNPELHNAVMHVEDESADANMVVEVFAKGYRMGDKVLRYSLVKVAN